MQKFTKPILFFVAGIVTTLIIVIGFSFKKADDKEETVKVNKDGKLQYKWSAPELPKSLSFAGERVPLDHPDVHESLDRELLLNYYNQYNTIYVLKLAERYFPVIEPILKDNGVPEDFKFLCIAESSLQNLTSRAGAIGLWQFMKDTAPQYGLEVNDEVDERYNIEKSTEAACRYFKKAKEKFGSWTSAAASYNMGMTGFANQVNYQEENNYYNLLLSDETMRYVFRILSYKVIVSNPEDYGFFVDKHEVYKPLKTKKITVTNTIEDMQEFAKSKGINYRKLKQLNPWLRDHRLTVHSGKSYEILLPKD
jgi:hypothetical protein